MRGWGLESQAWPYCTGQSLPAEMSLPEWPSSVQHISSMTPSGTRSLLLWEEMPHMVKDSASMSMTNVFPSRTAHSTQLFPLCRVTAETARPFSNAQ